MTKDELMAAVLSRHGKNKYYNSTQVAEALGITAKGMVEKIRKLKCDDEFKQTNFIGRSYNDAANTYRIYYDVTKQGVMLLLLKQQSDQFRIAMIEKITAFLK